MSEDDKTFFVPFEDKNASDKPPIPTELVRPVLNGLDFSKIGNFRSILGSVSETGQTFRNVFNNSVSPSTIASLSKAGLSSELSSLLSDGGISKFIDQISSGFKKTSYSYVESEKKLEGAKNIEIDFNPLGMFSQVLNMINSSVERSDDDTTIVDQFYSTINQVRRIIFNTNGSMYVNLEKIRVLHKQVDREQDFAPLNKIFWSEEVYSERYNIKDQIRNLNRAIEEYLKDENRMAKYVSDKADYKVCIDILKSQLITLTSCLKYKEIQYVFEDLKLLRKTPGIEYTPLS